MGCPRGVNASNSLISLEAHDAFDVFTVFTVTILNLTVRSGRPVDIAQSPRVVSIGRWEHRTAVFLNIIQCISQTLKPFISDVFFMAKTVGMAGKMTKLWSTNNSYATLAHTGWKTITSWLRSCDQVMSSRMPWRNRALYYTMEVDGRNLGSLEGMTLAPSGAFNVLIIDCSSG